MTATVPRDELHEEPREQADHASTAPEPDALDHPNRFSQPTPRRVRSLSTGGPLPRELPLQLLVVAGLSLAAVLSFRSAVADWAFLSSGVLGVAGPILISAISRRLGLLTGETVASSIAGFLLLGPAAVMEFPTPGGYGLFLTGLIDGWANLLSSLPPTDLTPELRVVPYALAWAAALFGTELLRWQRHPLLPMLGPALSFVFTLLLVPDPGFIGTSVAASLGIGALFLGAGGTRKNAASMLGLLCAVAVLAPTVGSHLPLADANERFNLRRFQERPWNPLDGPSPLVTLKASLKDGRSDDVVFTVQSAAPITRWSLAVLGDYNGIVWAVADESTDAPAQFRPVDSTFPTPPDNIQSEDVVDYQLEFGDLGGVWLPVAGWPLHANRVGELDLRLNENTGTVASANGLPAGHQIHMQAYLRPELSDADLLAATAVSNDDDAELVLVSPAVRNTAGDIFEGVDAGTPRAVALSTAFVRSGFYDHSDQSRPGHSLARIDEFLADPERLVGYAENYAAAAGVIARIGGLPSRVVVGYVISEDRYVDGVAQVVAQDITAWIEIETVEYGWVPLTVTPDQTREPDEEQLGVTVKDIAIPNPPPPPPPPPDPKPTAQTTDENAEDKDETESAPEEGGPVLPLPVLIAGTTVGGPVLVLGVLAGLVVSAKTLRRRTRRNARLPAVRVVGAWHEVLDRYDEAGMGIGPETTPYEAVSLFTKDNGVQDARRELLLLADRVDRVSFHPTPATENEANDAWRMADTAVTHLSSRRSRWQRLCLKTDPRPVLRPRRLPENAQ